VELGREPDGDGDRGRAHGHGRGGAFPAAAGAAGTAAAPCRWSAGGSAGVRVRPEARARIGSGPDAALRRFYYDTVTHDHDLLADLVRYAGAGQVLLGSDRPFDMGSDDPVGEVRALGLGASEELVLGGNAARC
jgi:hypothetical protein